MSSAAVAVRVTVPLTKVPGAGAVSATVGGSKSFDTMTLVLLVATLPAASRAIAVRTWVPLATEVVGHDMLIGRGRVLDAERAAVEEELDAGHRNVVGGRRRHQHLAGDATPSTPA